MLCVFLFLLYNKSMVEFTNGGAEMKVYCAYHPDVLLVVVGNRVYPCDKCRQDAIRKAVDYCAKKR